MLNNSILYCCFIPFCVVFVFFYWHCACLYKVFPALTVLSSVVAVCLLELVIHYYCFVTVRDKDKHFYTINTCAYTTHMLSHHMHRLQDMFLNLFFPEFVIIVIHVQPCACVFIAEDPKCFLFVWIKRNVH